MSHTQLCDDRALSQTRLRAGHLRLRLVFFFDHGRFYSPALSVRCERFHLTEIGDSEAQRATVKMSHALYGKGLSLDIAGDESLRFEDNVLTDYGSIDLAVDHHASSVNATVDKGFG